MIRFPIPAALAAAAGAALLAGCASASGTAKPIHQAASHSTTSPAAATTPAPPPENPSATGQGSCDYTLANSPYGNHHLIGEMDVTNTGNVGVKVRVKITWPQEGAPPIAAHKTARVPFGQSKAVRFSVAVPASGNVIDLLQSWQERHNFRDGCHYHASIIGTFGSAQ